MVDVKRWYGSLRAQLSFKTSLSGLLQFIWHSYHEFARAWPERVSITAFYVRFAASCILPNSFTDDVAVRLRGTTYTLGLRSKELHAFEEIYHYHVYDQVADFIPQSGWTVFDIGANAGIFSVLQVRRGAQVYAFEPNLDCFRRLSKTVAENRLGDRLHLYNSALGATSGTGMMIVPSGWTSAGSVRRAEGEADGAGDTTVTITSLDDVVRSLRVARIDLLKIDTEGAEVDVLRGAAQSLQMVRHVVLEYHTQDLLRQVRALLLERGFTQVLDSGQGILYMSRTQE